ncbi:hypothetical protein [Candidatus Palauibacter sp.]|uniref:hypothetical protein n=1 Tax=Candidatus Palauibacter sp. TaxID=3101350 RepID=UPI003CC52DF7
MNGDEGLLLDLGSISGGAIPEMFACELEQVLKNIHDPNVPAEAVRELHVVVKIKPDADRHRLAISSHVTKKLPPRQAASGQAFTGERGGHVVAVTYDPRQSDLFRDDREAGVTPLPTPAKEAPSA